MKKKVTLKDIAAKAGLSPASVSMILNHKSIDRFNTATVEQVFALAESLDYQGGKGRGLTLVKPADTLIIVVCPSLVNPFYTTLIQGIEIAARRRGFTTSVRTTYWDTDTESFIMEQAKKLNVAGVIFAMIPQQPQLAYDLSRSLPVVAIGDRRSDLSLATVDMNNFNAGLLMGRHLLGLGHRNLAYISTTLNEQHTSRVRRCQGLEAACREVAGSSLTVFTREITPDFELSHVDVEYRTGYALAQECLARAPQTTAVAAINDMVAYGAYNALADSGLRIPQDVSLCGFDNIFPSRLHGVSLTSIDNSLAECGKSAFHLLEEEIASYRRHGRFESITHVEYKCRLMPRASTGPVPGTPRP